jgi:hypothetical protein
MIRAFKSFAMILTSLTLLQAFQITPTFAELSKPEFKEKLKILKKLGTNYTVVGTVCEKLAMQQIMDGIDHRFSEKTHDIYNGIVVFDVDQHRILGEIDLAVFDAYGSNVANFEVKCWGDNAQKALIEARGQLDNLEKIFTDTIAYPNLKIYLASDKSIHFDREQFIDVNHTVSFLKLTYSDKGGEGKFDYALDVTRNDVEELWLKFNPKTKTQRQTSSKSIKRKRSH